MVPGAGHLDDRHYNDLRGVRQINLPAIYRDFPPICLTDELDCGYQPIKKNHANVVPSGEPIDFPDHIPAGFFVPLKLQLALVFGFLEQIVEGAAAEGCFAEIGAPALQSLLDH